MFLEEAEGADGLIGVDFAQVDRRAGEARIRPCWLGDQGVRQRRAYLIIEQQVVSLDDVPLLLAERWIEQGVRVLAGASRHQSLVHRAQLLIRPVGVLLQLHDGWHMQEVAESLICKDFLDDGAQLLVLNGINGEQALHQFEKLHDREQRCAMVVDFDVDLAAFGLCLAAFCFLLV